MLMMKKPKKSEPISKWSLSVTSLAGTLHQQPLHRPRQHHHRLPLQHRCQLHHHNHRLDLHRLDLHHHLHLSHASLSRPPQQRIVVQEGKRELLSYNENIHHHTSIHLQMINMMINIIIYSQQYVVVLL